MANQSHTRLFNSFGLVDRVMSGGFCFSARQKLASVKNMVRMREEMITEKQQFLDNEIENNKEQEKKISLAERTAAKMRLDYQEAEQQRDQFQSEVWQLSLLCLALIFII